MQSFLVKFLILLICSTFATSCTKERFKGKKAPHVVVSIPPYISLVKEIVEDTVTVTSLMDGNFDPHVSETTPLQVKKVQKADLFIGIGELYEKKLLKAVKHQKTLTTLHLNQIVPLLPYLENHSMDPSFEGAVGCHHHFSSDPHFYLSPKLLVFQVKALTEALSNLNPQKAPQYAQKGALLVKKIQSLDEKLTDQLNPYKQRAIVISHAALGYFCHDYGLIQIATESEGKSPLPKDVWTMYQVAKRSHAICAFILPQFNNKGVEMIAQELNLRIESFNPLDEEVLQAIENIGNILAKGS